MCFKSKTIRDCGHFILSILARMQLGEQITELTKSC